MVRRAAVIAALAALCVSAIPAEGQVQLVVGVISPALGIPVDDAGRGSAAPRDGMTVTREVHGSVVTITMVPRP